ncbi:MAG TPA: class I SAM-dependent methyltransferase, partial [Trebonia sp.]
MATDQTSYLAGPQAPQVSRLALRGFALPQGTLGRLGGLIMARGNQAANGEITGLLDIRAGDQVLEVGYGPGVLLRQLAEHTLAARVTGVDPSPVMRDMARRRCAAAIAVGRADPRLGTATRTGLPGAAFDHVVSVNNVLFWGDIPAGFAELRRVLRPGG